MFVSFATMLIQKLEQVVSFINSVFMEAPRLQEFFNVLDAVPAVRDRIDAIDPGRLQGMVEFSDVSFSYDGKRPAVEDLSFTALPGQTIALVGPTGAGKSTAIALLHRAFDPQSGFIRIDGMDVRGLTLTALRRNIGVVFQEALLFNRSIADNLRVGKPDATDEELRIAATRAQALEFIERSDLKFDTNAGERGRMLSGGERQRLSIARALLKDPPILILDEATSALDAVTEARVNAALDEVMKGRTTFVIAHRLSTIRNATRILVFENGRVIESGTFDELVARGGHFAELAKAQFMVQENARAQREFSRTASIAPGEESEIDRNLAAFIHDLIARATVLDRCRAGIGLRRVPTGRTRLNRNHHISAFSFRGGLKDRNQIVHFLRNCLDRAGRRSLALARDACAARRAGRSAAGRRSRQRQGAAGRERDLSVVSGIDDQADDRLRHAEGGQGRPDHAGHAVHGVADRGVPVAVQDGLPRRHPGHRRQCAEDDAGEVGQRHGRGARRRPRRLDRRLLPPR